MLRTVSQEATMFVRKHPLVAYFGLAYAITWIIHIPLALSAQGLLYITLPAGVHFLGAYGPMLAAFIVTGMTQGTPGLRDLLDRMSRWQVGISWLSIAVFSPAALFLVSAVIVRAWVGAWPDFRQFGYILEFPTLGWLAGWIIWTLTFGLGEETGWRGFALPRLQRNRDPLAATLILGGLWALWHLPQFFYNYELTLFGVMAFTVSTVSGALVLTWLCNSTGGSVLVTAIWHGAFNTAVAGAQGAMAPLVSGFVILAAVLIARWSGPELRYRPGPGRTTGTGFRRRRHTP
jgi:membrane protease YdiL (CAAX protease family)